MRKALIYNHFDVYIVCTPTIDKSSCLIKMSINLLISLKGMESSEVNTLKEDLK